MEISGVLKLIKATEKKTDTFQLREFVLTVDDNGYTQYIAFQLTQNNCDLMDNFSEGQPVKVSFNIRGREWTSPQGEVRYFNTLQAWKIDADGEAAAPPVEDVNTQSAPSSGEGDLPF